jgi:hypothetical protein
MLFERCDHELRFLGAAVKSGDHAFASDDKVSLIMG